MTVSGIVLACRPENLEEVISEVNALGWAEVHHSDTLGRMVATIEASDIDQSVKRLKQLQALPHVATAELAAYVTEDHENTQGCIEA